MTVAQAGTRLKVPARVVEILESGQWEALGAPVFVRGHVRSYARALGVDIGAYLDQSLLQAVRPVELVSRTHTPRYQRVLESTARRAVYVVITVCFFAVPFWLVVFQQFRQAGTEDRLAGRSAQGQAPLAPSNVTAAAPVAAPAPAPQVEQDNAPITASMARAPDP